MKCFADLPTWRTLHKLAGDSCGYGFSSGEDAAETALNIWELFLGGYPTKSTATRPFGNATLDGIDLDIECAANGTDPMYYTTFVQQLRSLMQNGSSSSAATESLDTEYAAVETILGTANYLITAAPQCVFPDAYLGPQLAGLALTDVAMQFDYLWPQFYNNHICQYNEADQGADFQQSFQNWSSWANASAPALEVLVGLPASPSAASTGYIADSDEVKQINMIRRSNVTNFDGVMLWSAAWEFENEQMNQSYIPSVLKSLTGKLISLSFILTVLHPLFASLPRTHYTSNTITKILFSHGQLASCASYAVTVMLLGMCQPRSCPSLIVL